MNTIVIGVDAGERARDAVAFARHFDRARLIAVTGFPVDGAPGYAALRDTALDTLATATRNLDAERRALAGTSAARTLHDIAEATEADLVIVGSSHTGRLGRVLPGSTGEKLLHGAPCAVAVVPRGYEDRPIARIGVAYDGSDEAKAALATATALARRFGARLELIGVAGMDYYAGPAIVGGAGYDLDALRGEVEQHVRDSLAKAAAALPAGTETVLRSGDAAQALTERTEQLDLIVTGSRGYGPLRSVLVGGVSGKLIRDAHCPVIVVPRGASHALMEVA